MKNFIRFSTFWCLIMLSLTFLNQSQSLNAQTSIPITIGTGTSTSSYPFYNFWSNSHSQFLYTKSEIIAAGGAAGDINAIAFNVSNYVSGWTMPNFKITIANTSLTSLPTTLVVDSLFTICYAATTYSVPGTGWQKIPFTTPFAWNGDSNIIIIICWDQSTIAYTSPQSVFSTTMTGERKSTRLNSNHIQKTRMPSSA